MPDGVTYNHETLSIDGEAFTDCQFRNVRLVYAGGENPTFKRCKFDGCEWRFEGPAARTLAHLKQLWSVGAKASVQAVIKEVTEAPR